MIKPRKAQAIPPSATATAAAPANTMQYTAGGACTVAASSSSPPALNSLHCVASRSEQASELKLEQTCVAEAPRSEPPPPTVVPPAPGTTMVTPKSPPPCKFETHMS